MEINFLCLGTQDGLITVEEEAHDESKVSVMRNSGMQWSFSNKVSAVPQFLSFKTNQEDRSRKNSLDTLRTHGYMTKSAADALESNQKPQSGTVQKNAAKNDAIKHVASQCGMTVYPAKQLDVYPVRFQEARAMPFFNQSNHTSHIVLSNSVGQSCLASNGQNVVNAIIKKQPLGGLPPTAPVSILPPRGAIVGTTDLRSASKSAGVPTQLTIFYGGSVCVYNDISPDKVQAIMLLAGNGSSPTQNKIVPKAQMQPSVPVPSNSDCFVISKSCSSALPSSWSISSNAGSQSVGVSFTVNDPPQGKPLCSSASNINHTEPPNIVSSVGAATASLAPSVALPQARKASLARFLEKRKERVVSTSPYPLSKRPLDCSTPGSESNILPANSFGSAPFQISISSVKTCII